MKYNVGDLLYFKHYKSGRVSIYQCLQSQDTLTSMYVFRLTLDKSISKMSNVSDEYLNDRFLVKNLTSDEN